MNPTLPQWITDLDQGARHDVIPAGDVAIHWRSWGEGEPLILLHGGSGSWMHWARNIGPLSERYRVIVPDLPAFGDSDSFETTSLDAYGALLVPGIRALTDGPVRIAGFSFGSVIGLSLFAHGINGPDYVMLGSPVLGKVHPVTDQLQKWRGLPIPADRLAAHRNNVAMLMIHDPAKVTDEAAAIQMSHAERARGRYRGIFHGIDVLAYLSQRAGKLSVIYGDHDALCWRHLPERQSLVEKLEGAAEFTLLPGVGHWVPYEAADEVNRRLLAL
jgi:pimeloyl-ACP methyl ester carboxylesterase